jgi:N-acetylneuraminic acid mutarotase
VVLANGTATVTVSAGASSWAFASSFAAGSTYAVTVQAQPTGETCQVISGGSGSLNANVTNVTVACAFGLWTWAGGTTASGGSGTFGTEGTASASNLPPARQNSATWIDSSGNLWLFGGATVGSYGNDLWEYSPSSGEWTWVSGSSSANATGVYGTEGTAAAGNVPGARERSASWIDSSGNFWLFGGLGYAASGGVASLNDLWKYTPSSGEWTWVSGSNSTNASGVYGTKGTAAAGNVPGARSGPAGFWIDSSGNFWLFGGFGVSGILSDLWKFSPGSGEWTWVSGGNGINALGVYGTQGVAASGNVPGARFLASSWLDASGNFWLFGGGGYGSSGAQGSLNDLWKYALSTGQWTWVSGSSATGAEAVYGTEGVASASSVPGARFSPNPGAWIDSSGNLWLFGGSGINGVGSAGFLNDVWEFTPSSGQWTWVGGGQGVGTYGVYGTEGTASPSNAPGGRQGPDSWIDSSGNLWMFGGGGWAQSGSETLLNDLWYFTPVQ